MSFTTPDFADAVIEQLETEGYKVLEPDDEDENYRWTFADAYVSGPYESLHSAWSGAFEDWAGNFGRLQHAAARVIGTWQKGDLADAVNDLQASLNECISGSVEDLVEQAFAQDQTP